MKIGSEANERNVLRRIYVFHSVGREYPSSVREIASNTADGQTHLFLSFLPFFLSFFPTFPLVCFCRRPALALQALPLPLCLLVLFARPFARSFDLQRTISSETVTTGQLQGSRTSRFNMTPRYASTT